MRSFALIVLCTFFSYPAFTTNSPTKTISTIEHSENEIVLSVAVSWDGRYIVTGTDKDLIRVFDTDNHCHITDEFHLTQIISSGFDLNTHHFIRAYFQDSHNGLLSIVSDGNGGPFLLTVRLRDYHCIEPYMHANTEPFALFSRNHNYGIAYHNFPDSPETLLALFRKGGDGYVPFPIQYCNRINLMTFSANEFLMAGACEKILYIWSLQGDKPYREEFTHKISWVRFIPDNTNMTLLVAAGNKAYIINAEAFASEE